MKRQLAGVLLVSSLSVCSLLKADPITVFNPGFEEGESGDGRPNGWTAVPELGVISGILEGIPHQGNTPVRFAGQDAYWIYQVLPSASISATDLFTLEWWAYGTVGVQQNVALFWTDDPLGTFDVSYINLHLSAQSNQSISASYQQYSLESASIPSVAVGNHVGIALGMNPGIGVNLYVDDVSLDVSPVPETAAYSIFFGGLATACAVLIRRRRQ